MPLQFLAAACSVDITPLVSRSDRDRFHSDSTGCLPEEDDDGCNPMRRIELPEEERKLKNNVGDVENGQEPFVSITNQVKVLTHTSNDRITNIATIEGVEHV